MKESRSTDNRQSKQGQSKKPRPEIRDDLDSRERKEKSAHAGNRNDLKGDDEIVPKEKRK